MYRNSISIIIPVFCAEHFIEELIERCIRTTILLDCQFEIILIDDQSTDQTFKKLIELAVQFPQISIYQNQNNFGQHATIKKGLLLAKNKWTIIMDCDLQDLPEDIFPLYTKATEVEHSVIAKRKLKNHPFFKKISSYFFNLILSIITLRKYSHTTGNFGIYPTAIIQKIGQVPDDSFFFPVLIRKVEKSPTFIYLNHGIGRRKKSTYSFFKLLQLGLIAYRSTKQHIGKE